MINIKRWVSYVCSGSLFLFPRNRNSKTEISGKPTKSTGRNPFYILHFVQAAIPILRYLKHLCKVSCFSSYIGSTTCVLVLKFWDFMPCSYSNFPIFQVRVYTPKRVLQELETAKEEYIRATFGVRKDKKVVLPKIIESFAKESRLCSAGMMEMIQKALPESLRKSVTKCQNGKSRKNVEWMPHNFTFRYLISREIVRWSLDQHSCCLNAAHHEHNSLEWFRDNRRVYIFSSLLYIEVH